MKDIPAFFGSKVFNEDVMQARLPKETYRSLRQTMESGKPLDIEIAHVVANAMKDWAVDKGATHFTHWFQPMTGFTAEKHESFISPSGSSVIMEFSGKELVRGEPDASSFPSGGLRATFEARGYTAWDPTSYAFIKDDTLCIPTAFFSYSGDALDQKTPLLRSLEALEKQAMRILRLFGEENIKRVFTTVGAEQEYFLIDKSVYEKRPDLLYCGRTLFGARPPKGQEMEDHYFGTIKPRVSAFMKDINEQLWSLGVLAKTEHNETAPAQHELAPVFTTVNLATDHNQLTMDIMRSTAGRHGLACLLHEKPFAGVNGSGKHNNWSMVTDTGENLFEPGRTPWQNARFLIFLLAVIKAGDEHQDLLRISVSSAGNDHRLGANEAPPAIISMFLGDDLKKILDEIEAGSEHHDLDNGRIKIGATVLPSIPKDATDRNRTSPFAFTGNKFEFRSLGSSMSISAANTVINTIVADALSDFADKLEGSGNFAEDLNRLIRDTYREHKRIVFNGNNYSADWKLEAEKRGLLNLETAVDAVPRFMLPDNIALFKKHSVYTENEIHSRYEIMLESYCKTLHIEALTMCDMARRDIMPAVIGYVDGVASAACGKKTLGISAAPEEKLLSRLTELEGELLSDVERLECAVETVEGFGDTLAEAKYYRDEIRSAMSALRRTADSLEMICPSGKWPYPTYGEILYSVR